MKRRWLIYMFLILVQPILFGQEAPVSDQQYEALVEELGYDKTKNRLRLRAKYHVKPQEQKSTKRASPFGSIALQFIAYLLVFTLVGLILYMVFSNIQIEKSLDHVEDDFEEIENIEDVDADAAYKAAVAAGDYRLAIRMHFIKCLQVLAEKDHIEWEREKTNRDYNREISNSEVKRTFREVATIFERCWYGEESLDVIAFRRYDQSFLDLLNLVK